MGRVFKLFIKYSIFLKIIIAHERYIIFFFGRIPLFCTTMFCHLLASKVYLESTSFGRRVNYRHRHTLSLLSENFTPAQTIGYSLSPVSEKFVIFLDFSPLIIKYNHYLLKSTVWFYNTNDLSYCSSCKTHTPLEVLSRRPFSKYVH